MPFRLPRLALPLVLGALLSACDQAPQARTEQMLAFGTLVDITLVGVSDKVADEAFADARRDLEFMHEAWHPWKPGPMGRTNQLLQTGGWFSANPSVMPLIAPARRLERTSRGLFNPTLGKLEALWGFHTDERPEDRPPPAPEAIAALVKQAPSMEDIQVKGIRMRGTNPAVQLDVGGFAKGIAIDRVIARFRELGIENAIVNAGGDLRAIGRHGERPWRIGIRNPRGEGVIAAVEVSGDESVFTSGDYERYFIYKGKRYHHILDPRTGYPARGAVSVTVIHPDATTADAAATALFVAGPDQWESIARSMGVKDVMLVDESGKVYMTPSMARRVELLEDPKPPVVISGGGGGT